MRWTCWSPCLLTLLVACGGDGTDSEVKDTDPIDTQDTGTVCDPAIASVPSPDFQLEPDFTTTTFVPSEVDAAADLEPEKLHLVAAPATPSIDHLFVFLPDAGKSPAEYQWVTGAAARSGFRAIALAWPTDDAKATLCADQGDSCFEGMNEEKAYGSDDSTLIDVDTANSVEGRLAALLGALVAAEPDGGWDAYVTDGNVSWEDVVLGGHGEGATLAGWIGRDMPLAATALWGSGCDMVAGQPGAWCYDPRATPPDLIYGIAHENEGYEDAVASWEALGMDDFGVVADADVEAPRYCTGTHSLSTNLPPEDASTDYFQALAVDGKFNADDGGVPLLAEDWWYLMTAGARL